MYVALAKRDMGRQLDEDLVVGAGTFAHRAGHLCRPTGFSAWMGPSSRQARLSRNRT